MCIHEEDSGLLSKHTDFRDGSVISARYGFYYIFTLYNTYRLEMKLTGMLNTCCLRPSESALPFGAQVAAGLTAHNHQHIFSRVDPEIDYPKSSIVQNDAVPSEAPAKSSATVTHYTARRRPSKRPWKPRQPTPLRSVAHERSSTPGVSISRHRGPSGTRFSTATGPRCWHIPGVSHTTAPRLPGRVSTAKQVVSTTR
ncbi:Putative copper amine oxidase [Colletotrichum destructivum]|uniref:Amine oxidase n=1 Tax=Colletotrichum destructivum TaxID=34406 RepID=A0AAX4IDT7_9PEZI|nr:Putative copper amine oxidase [Colletotrichum destructivum]